MTTRTDMTTEEQIEALESKCALLSAALKQAESESKSFKGDATDFAALQKCYAGWQFALFQAIEHYTDEAKYSVKDGAHPEAKRIGTMQTVNQLAGIGIYFADRAWSEASEHCEEVSA